jgi:hypothetical protein
MTNVQFPMTNAGGKAERAASSYHSISIRHWDLVIGILSLPRIIREGLRD